MRTPILFASAALVAGLVAACGKPEPESPHMSAGKHDEKARSEERAASAHLNSSDDALVVGERCLPSNLTANDPIGCWTAWRTPNDRPLSIEVSGNQETLPVEAATGPR